MSDITGINIDVARGRVSFGAPRPERIPQMLQRLPQNTAQFFLNPLGGGLAFEIRRAKEQARKNCSSIPPAVVNQLSPFFPPDVFTSVCGAVVSNGFTLDSWVIRDGGMGAITLEDVTVFRDNQAFNDPILWSHELTHALQYRRLGVEAFAAIYAGAWDSLEQEARNFDQFVTARLQAQYTAQVWQAEQGWNGPAYSSNQYSTAAKQVISPTDCVQSEFMSDDEITNILNDPNQGNAEAKTFARKMFQNNFTAVTVSNNCPIGIMVTATTDGNVKMPCPELGEPDCLVSPGRFGYFYATKRANRVEYAWQ